MIKNWLQYNEGVHNLNEAISLAESQLPEDVDEFSSLSIDDLEAVVADTSVSDDGLQKFIVSTLLLQLINVDVN